MHIFSKRNKYTNAKKEDASFQVFDLYMVVPTQPSPFTRPQSGLLHLDKKLQSMNFLSCSSEGEFRFTI